MAISVPVTDAWRDELRRLTEALGLLPKEQEQQQQLQMQQQQQQQETERPRTRTMYSPQTGRLIPPPSRAMSRAQTRSGSRQSQRGYPPFQHIAQEPDNENMVNRE